MYLDLVFLNFLHQGWHRINYFACLELTRIKTRRVHCYLSYELQMHQHPHAQVPFRQINSTIVFWCSSACCALASFTLCAPQNSRMPSLTGTRVRFATALWSWSSTKHQEWRKKRANLMQPVGSFAIVSMCKYVLVHCNAFVRPPYKSMVCAHAQAPFISVISRCICWTSTKA